VQGLNQGGGSNPLPQFIASKYAKRNFKLGGKFKNTLGCPPPVLMKCLTRPLAVRIIFKQTPLR